MDYISIFEYHFVNIYNKYKPISFRELIFKFTGKTLPTWEQISYKVKILIGIDPYYLNKPK